jgi:ribonuclease HI
MNSFALFTDVSVNPQRKLGMGGYLLVPVAFLENEPHDIERGDVSAQIKIKRFEETSSTKLEVQTVLWALEKSREEITGSALGSLRIYTDSQ